MVLTSNNQGYVSHSLVVSVLDGSSNLVEIRVKLLGKESVFSGISFTVEGLPFEEELLSKSPVHLETKDTIITKLSGFIGLIYVSCAPLLKNLWTLGIYTIYTRSSTKLS